MKKHLTFHFPCIVLFVFTLAIGLLHYKDYGISWDEAIQRGLGMTTWNYVVHGDKALMEDHDKALGTGYELPLIFMEQALQLKDPAEIYPARHLFTHIFFLLSACCGYLLAYRLFRNRFIACLGFVMLVYTPRLYAHSFFNSKDIPFLSAFLICLFLCQVTFSKNKMAWYFLLGLACGYATSIRAMGIALLPCISLILVADLASAIYNRVAVQRALLNILLFFAGFCLMLYTAWPYLWQAPVPNFFGAFHSLATIFSGGNVLFRGRFYPSEHLPPDYMPVWFSITVPELWLIAGLAGFVYIMVCFVRKPLKYLQNNPERNYLLYAACFAGPVIAMIVFNGVNIDDWRHLYFIYPSFVMLALLAISKLTQTRYKIVVQALCAAQVAVTGWFMVRNHPYQQVYFNSFVSHKKEFLHYNYDLEYWGCAYKQALEHVVATDHRDTINIRWGTDPLRNNILLLPEKDRKRIRLVEFDPDYMITNFRNRPAFFKGLQAVYSKSVLNSTIICVYKMH